MATSAFECDASKIPTLDALGAFDLSVPTKNEVTRQSFGGEFGHATNTLGYFLGPVGIRCINVEDLTPAYILGRE